MQLVHGGDWAGYRAEFGRDALDFSANVSPLGLPEGVARAITAALPTADRYPDPLCRELRAKLALHEGVSAEQILCGNGAADLIFRLVWAKKPRRALVTAPTFAEYATALESVGCTVERFFLREQEDFAVTDAFCAAIRPGVDMVFLCQPNNPTGQLTALPLVEQILHRCAACGTLLVVDECFLDFLPDHALHTAKGLLGEGNLVILKAFTKLYGMAGVRLGYALSADESRLARMQAAGQPWAVSGLAQAAGISKSYVWELENRDVPHLSVKVLVDLAKALGVTTQDLMGEPPPVQASPEDLQFFRKYIRMDRADKDRLRTMVDLFDRPAAKRATRGR